MVGFLFSWAIVSSILACAGFSLWYSEGTRRRVTEKCAVADKQHIEDLFKYRNQQLQDIQDIISREE